MHGITGAKGGTSGLPSMPCTSRHTTRFDVVMAWTWIVSGRSCRTLWLPIRAACAGDRPIPASTGHGHHDPGGKAMFQMMGVFAEFERSMIRGRVNAGIARAKVDGKHCGRPFIDASWKGASVRLWLRLVGQGFTRSLSSSASAAARSSALPGPVLAAESKSTYFRRVLFNAHSEKSMKFDQLPINRLPANSERDVCSVTLSPGSRLAQFRCPISS